MTKAEKKLSVLKSGKNKMAPGGSRTSEVTSKVSAIKTAFQDYIKSDNTEISEQIMQRLNVSIEEHSDFGTAVSYINRAINNAQDAVNEEKEVAKNE